MCLLERLHSANGLVERGLDFTLHNLGGGYGSINSPAPSWSESGTWYFHGPGVCVVLSILVFILFDLSEDVKYV